MKTTTEVLEGVDLTGKTFLVTGATTGLGFETARSLLAAGATVTITARSAEKGKAAVAQLTTEVADAKVDFCVVELSSLSSVRTFTDEFLATHDRLDVLIANAGIMAVPYGLTEDGFELHFGTNHLGHFVLVGRLLPLLLQSDAPRIVMLTSAGHGASDIIWEDPNFVSADYSKLTAYGQSKTANMLHAVELENRYGDRGLHAWSVHPGMVSTDLGRHFTKEDYAELIARAKYAGGELPPRVGVDVGASTQVWAAVSDDVLAFAGGYLADCAQGSAARYALDANSAQRLWELSEQMVGENFPVL